MLKKLATLGAAALFVIGTFAIADLPADTSSPDDEVGICHFPGHNGDFVLGNQTPGGTASGCRGANGVTDGPLAGPNSTNEGIVMFVGRNACAKGHKAAPAFGGTNLGNDCYSTP